MICDIICYIITGLPMFRPLHLPSIELFLLAFLFPLRAPCHFLFSFIRQRDRHTHAHTRINCYSSLRVSVQILWISLSNVPCQDSFFQKRLHLPLAFYHRAYGTVLSATAVPSLTTVLGIQQGAINNCCMNGDMYKISHGRFGGKRFCITVCLVVFYHCQIPQSTGL